MDIIGHSHQWWHFFIFLALLFWHHSGVVWATFRLVYRDSYDLSESTPFEEPIENETNPYFRADTGCAAAPSEDAIDRMRMWPF